MTFCAYDMQTACFHDFVVLFLPAVFQFGDTCCFFFFAQVFIGTDGICLMFDVTSKYDVGTASGHIGGNGNRADFTGLGHNEGFPLVLFCVQDIVGDALLIQQMGNQF